jgi:hypothetical protein
MLDFRYPESRNGLAWAGSMLSRTNFVNIEAAEDARRKAGSVLRNAMAVTSSEGQTPSRMVLSHDPKDDQTSRGWQAERY